MKEVLDLFGLYFEPNFYILRSGINDLLLNPTKLVVKRMIETDESLKIETNSVIISDMPESIYTDGNHLFLLS